jgi:hypothetical protein
MPQKILYGLVILFLSMSVVWLWMNRFINTQVGATLAALLAVLCVIFVQEFMLSPEKDSSLPPPTPTQPPSSPSSKNKTVVYPQPTESKQKAELIVERASTKTTIEKDSEDDYDDDDDDDENDENDTQQRADDNQNR